MSLTLQVSLVSTNWTDQGKAKRKKMQMITVIRCEISWVNMANEMIRLRRRTTSQSTWLYYFIEQVKALGWPLSCPWILCLRWREKKREIHFFCTQDNCSVDKHREEKELILFNCRINFLSKKNHKRWNHIHARHYYAFLLKL